MARLGIDRDFPRELGKLERLRPERSGGTVNSTPRTFRPAGDVGSVEFTVAPSAETRGPRQWTV